MGVVRIRSSFFGSSLTEALEQAKAGDTLLLAPGKYCHEALRLENLTLRAESPGETTVIFNSVMVLGEVHLEGIALRGRGNSPLAQLFLQKCHPNAGEFKRHIIADCAARLNVENCTIHAGIGLLEGSRAAITNTEMRGFGAAALSIRGGSKATVDRCKIHDSTNGICIGRGGVAEVRNTEMWAIRKPAIHIEDPTSVATFVDCVIRDNFADAVVVQNEGRVTIEGTEIRQSADAFAIAYSKKRATASGLREFANVFTLIHIERGAHAVITRCKIHDTVGPGICVIDGGVGEVRNTEMWACVKSSIIIRGATSVATITECRIRDNRCDIWVDEEANATIRCSEIDRGIWVTNGAHAAIDRCKIHDSACCICLSVGGTTEVRDTKLSAWSDSAVCAKGRSTIVHMINCYFGTPVEFYCPLPASLDAVAVRLENHAYLKAEGCNLPEESCLVKNAVLDLVRDLTCDDCTGKGQPSDFVTITGTGEGREEVLEESQIIADLAAVVDLENATRGLIYRTKQWRN